MAKPSEPKTRPTDVPVSAFLASVEPAARRAEAEELIALVSRTTGVEPRMWGDAIVGWGETSMRYANGSALAWPALGFSPRKSQHTLYFLHGFDSLQDELSRIGPHRLGKGCLYLGRLDDIDREAFAALVARAWREG